MWADLLFSWLILLVLNKGLSFSSCTFSVSVQDLACHMHWSCLDMTNATTFTVQTMIQGLEWQNVSHCIRITSNSCDLSQVFDEFDLYKFVRLEVNQQHEEKIHLTSQLCDPLKELNASFSPPSLSILWGNQQLWVEVIFPCAPDAVCQYMTMDEEVNETSTPTCCAVNDIQEQNATITLYNKHNRDDFQTRTEMVGGSPWKQQFFNFTLGQDYCAVAHFASSPLSDPQCVHIPLPENPNLFVLAVCGVFIALLFIVGFVLRRWWCLCDSKDVKLPKSLMSLQSHDQEGSVVDEPRQADFEEEESIVHLSIISLNNLLPPDPCLFYLHLKGHVDKYNTTSTLSDQVCDTNYFSADVATEGVSDCLSSTHNSWPRWSSLPALRTGMVCLLGNILPSEAPVIPLSSVRVADEQITRVESDHSFQVHLNSYNDGDLSIC